MPTPKSREQELCEMFDSFSRKTIINLGKQVRRKYYAYLNRYMPTDPQLLEGDEDREDVYPSNNLTVFANELCCELNHQYMYEAFNAMPIEQRKVMILDYWYGWKDKQIAEYMEVTVRTVYNLKQRAYRTIIFYDEQERKDS